MSDGTAGDDRVQLALKTDVGDKPAAPAQQPEVLHALNRAADQQIFGLRGQVSSSA
jgi:hypothetical protein